MDLAKIVTIFKPILGSEKFNKDLDEARGITSNLNTYLELREEFAWFITAYPLSDSKKKVAKKLDGDKKLGLLSRHLASVSSRLNVGQLYLASYYELKEDEKDALDEVKKERWRYYYNGTEKPTDTEEQRMEISKSEGEILNERESLSRRLLSQTLELLEFCIKKYNPREDKINQILGDEESG